MTFKINSVPFAYATHSFIGRIAAYIVQRRNHRKSLLALFQPRLTSLYLSSMLLHLLTSAYGENLCGGRADCLNPGIEPGAQGRVSLI